MVCSLLQTYTKLRQLPRFFSELLSVICQPALDKLRPPLLCEVISTSLRTCLQDAPPSQCLEICSLVLESIRRYILPDLVKQERKAEKMETDGGDYDKAEKGEDKEDASLKLFSLSQLLHAVLFSLKSLDNKSPLPLVRQSQGLMEKMQQLVKELLEMLPTAKADVQTKKSLGLKTPRKGKNNLNPRESESESKMGILWEQKTQEAALLLKYTWVEVDTCFDIHCSKYTSLDSAKITAAREAKDQATAPVLTHIESLVSGDILPAHLHPSPSCSPMSCLLLRLLTLQQIKKVLLDGTLRGESSTTALINRAVHFISAKSELEGSLYVEQVWDGQIDSVSANSYPVAHWYLVTTNLPLIAPYLSEEDMGYIANVLVSSLLSRRTHGAKDQPRSCLTVSHISSQLLQSPILAELPSLFSATVCSLMQRIHDVLGAAHAPKICPMLLTFQEKGIDSKQPLCTLQEKETLVEDILASSKTGEVLLFLTDTQIKELVNLLQVLTNLNTDAMSPEHLSSIFLLLFFTLTSTSRLSDTVATDHPDFGDDAVFLVKLLTILSCFLEGRNFQSVLKLIHGGSLLQAAMSSLLWHSNNGRFRDTRSSDWLDLIKAVQDFIRILVQVIINRNSSVRLNLDQFSSFLTSSEIAKRQIVAFSSGKSDPAASVLSVHLLLASLTSFSQAMTSNLGRTKPMDQTLTQMLTRTTASLGPAVEFVLKPQTVSEAAVQPASILGQAFVVDIVTVMLHCELSSLSVEVENKLTLRHISLYQGIYQQILREISSAPRPMDFLVSSLNFLSTFYKAMETTRGEREKEPGEEENGGKELDELFIQILQNVHRLLTGTGAHYVCLVISVYCT